MDNKPKAIMFMLISALSFSFMSAMVKLAGDIPTFEKVFFRNLISLFLAIYMIKKSNVSTFGKWENQGALLSRSLFGLAGVVLNFYAINNLLLADSTMLNKISPFFVAIFAWWFLKERITALNIVALGVICVGAGLIIKPQFSLEIIPGLAGVLSALAAGAAYTIIRYLKDKEHPSTIVFYFSLVSVIGMIPFTAMNFVMPTGIQFVYLVGTGIFAALGQFTLTYAYKYAPASEVSIFNYVGVVFSAVIGYFMFGEVMDLYSVIGTILIIGMAVTLFFNGKSKIKSL